MHADPQDAWWALRQMRLSRANLVDAQTVAPRVAQAYSGRMRSIHLVPPDLSNPCRGEHISCVRPMRVGGPRVDSAIQDDKLVTHAYGFGGGGWTLAPGVARHALTCFVAQRRTMNVSENADVAVVGGGVIGLSIANRLAARPDIGSVTVYAESLQGLASHNAGGLLAPVSMGVEVGTIPWLRDVAVDAYRDWAGVARRERHLPWEQCGARFMDAYQKEGRIDMDPYIEAGLMAPPEEVVVRFGDNSEHIMDRFETLFMNTGAMMRRLHQRIDEAGIVCTQDKVKNFCELDEPIVFNCAGLGGGALAGEKTTVPVLGHLIRLKNQQTWTRQQYMTGSRLGSGQTYYIPKIDANTQGVLGGTFCEGVGDPNALPENFDAIWERGKTFFYGQPKGRDWYTRPR